MGNDTQLVGVSPNSQQAKYDTNLTGLVICVAIITAFFAARVYVRAWVVRQVCLEDWICLAAWLSQGFYLVTVFKMSEYILNSDEMENTAANPSIMLKWQYAGALSYIPACYSTKATILLVIARAFAVQQPVAKGIYTFMALLGLAYLPIQVIKIAMCIPIRAYWDPTVTGAHCIDQGKIVLSDMAIAVLTDVVIISLPVILLRSLHLPTRKKIKITALLVLGAGAIALTIYRMYRIVTFSDSSHQPTDYVSLDLTTSFELAIGMMCACFPAIDILVEHHWPSILVVTTPLPVHTKDIDPVHLASFNKQLAMLTGQPVEESIQIGPQVHQIQSSEGWREGWLAPRGYSKSSAALIDRTLNGDLIIPDVVWDGRTHNAKRH